MAAFAYYKLQNAVRDARLMRLNQGLHPITEGGAIWNPTIEKL